MKKTGRRILALCLTVLLLLPVFSGAAGAVSLEDGAEALRGQWRRDAGPDKGGYSLEDIGIPGGLGKELTAYGNQDAHVRGALYSNANLGTDFKRGSKPKRVYIKAVTGKYPQTDVLDFEYADQVPPEFVIDLETMLDKSIKQPISRIIEAIGMTWNDVDPSRTTLFDFGM